MKPAALLEVLEKIAPGFQKWAEGFRSVHSSGFADKSVADRQAYWLEKVLAEEHERDKKHLDRIELPD
jgi:hypothetical protein